MPLESHCFAADANASHDQKVMLHLILIILTRENGMVPLMTLLASCDTGNSIMGPHGQKVMLYIV